MLTKKVMLSRYDDRAVCPADMEGPFRIRAPYGAGHEAINDLFLFHLSSDLFTHVPIGLPLQINQINDGQGRYRT